LFTHKFFHVWHAFCAMRFGRSSPASFAWSMIISRHIMDELATIDLGDKRLNQRSGEVIEALSVDPGSSAVLTVRTRGAFDKWADTLAAYRLFDNPAVTPEAILQSHYEATLARIVEHPVVLVLQDTTELDFTKHPPKDARCLNKENRFGFYDHTHLAVTPAGMPLGVVGMDLLIGRQRVWDARWNGVLCPPKRRKVSAG